MIAGSSPSPTPSINDYISDGIKLWFDGIENTRSGHDSAATKWEDLSGNSRDADYSSGAIVADNYCSPNGEGFSIANISSSDIPNDFVFVEIVLDPNGTGSTTQMILPWGNAKRTTYIKTDAVCFWPKNASGSLSMLSGVHYYNSELFLDGAIVPNANVSGSWGSSYNSRIFSYSNLSSYPAQGIKVYALRCYNRVLTASEIQNNWLIDKARFGI